MRQVDLNADLGEGFGPYHLGNDKALLHCISSANIACGWHAGDSLIMEETVRTAVQNGAAVGAHPGYPDLLGFGRRKLNISPSEARTYLLYQLGALNAFAQAAGSKVRHVKLHGAFYNTAARDAALAQAVCEAVAAFDKNLILVAPSGSLLLQMAKERELRCASEVFADRAYQDDGALASRSLPNAVIHDRDIVLARTIRMIREGMIETISGKNIPILAETICIHGDNPQALALAQSLRTALEEEGISVVPMEQFL